ncbi:MAG TPA: cytochrome c, partial [Bryobacteraceae bacterium]|nr:cytochrome c [Bryobacteraceae bacterium]
SVVILMGACFTASAHDVITTKVTWTREISRLMFKRCTSCHREGGSSFPLTTYEQARPWAKAIKEEALERRMPPFGAVKGFGDLRDDLSLTQEQLELLSDWVEGGAPEGEARLLPKDPDLNPVPDAMPKTGAETIVDGSRTLKQAATFIAVRAKTLLEGSTIRVVAQRPDGTVAPLVWIYNYNPKFDQTYYFKNALTFPAGTKILTSSTTAGTIALLEPAGKTTAAVR